MDKPFTLFAYARRAASFLLSICLIILATNGFAAPTSKQDAENAVKGWLKLSAQPLNTKMPQDISAITEHKNAAGEVMYYVVSMKPEGYVVLSPDDLIEPIIAFSATGSYDSDPRNPMVTLLNKDLPQRLDHVEALQAEAKQNQLDFAPPSTLQGSQSKWKQFKDKAEEPVSMGDEPIAMGSGVSSIDDVRVASFIQSRWNQMQEGGQDCYNLYTPYNYYCGCVATALAQIMRFFEYPTIGVDHTQPFTVTVDGGSANGGEDITTYLRGGDDSGGPYAWSDMPLDPDASITLAQREAIGRLTADAGSTVSMNYTSSGSGAATSACGDALRNYFHYGNAVGMFTSSDGDQVANGSFNSMVNPNLDAGLPVIVGIRNTTQNTGHAIVCDGYGYNASTLYHHLNMGWGGSDDAWYNMPDVDADWTSYNVVNSCVYNIFTNGTGEIISGRVVNGGGTPQSGVTVTADDGITQYTDVTDSKGIYALIKAPSATTFTLSCPGAVSKEVTTGTSTSGGYDKPVGNLWAQDFLVASGPQVFYSTNTFHEASMNDGSIANTMTITLYDDTFTGLNGTDVSANVTVVNLPAGLTAEFMKDSDTQLTVSLTGTATSHGEADDVADLTFTFLDAAFTGGDASALTDYSKSDIMVDFHNVTSWLAEGADATSLPWSTSGDADWFYQTTNTHDGVDAIQSGVITDNQTTSVETTITGPGTLTFWWKVSSESGYDFLRLYLDDVKQSNDLAEISGEVDWVQKTVAIAEGSHTVKWSYEKDGSVSTPPDCGWVDQVVYTPDTTYEATITESGGSTDVSEDGVTDTYDVVLTSQPTADVTITITDDAQVNVSPASLMFTDANWDSPQTVTVSAEDDSTDEGLHTGTITHSASSVDGKYDGITISSVTANITDNDTRGNLGFAPSSYSVSEDGTSVRIYVTRTSGSNDAVSVDYATVDGTAAAGTDYTTASGTLTWLDGSMATKDFDVPVTDNTLYSGNRAFSVHLSNPTGGAGLGLTNASVTILEDEVLPSVPAGLVATPSVGQVALSWNAASDATGYIVKRSSTQGGEYTNVFGVATTNYTDSTVSDGSTYYYVVTATNPAGESDPSGEVSVTLLHTVPFTETFDGAGMASAIGPLSGQHGWLAGSNAVVEAGVGVSGSQGLNLGTGTAQQTFSNGTNTVAVSVWCKPVPGEEPAEVSADSAAVFWVDTNLNVRVYSNTTAVTLPAQITTNDYTHFEVGIDYAAGTWQISVDGGAAIAGLGLYSARTNFTTLRFENTTEKPFYIDDISIASAVVLSDYENWLSDHGLTTEDSGSLASNGVNTIYEAYIAGLDPNDPAARFALTDVGKPVDAMEINWSSVSGRLYNVYWSTNLLDGFDLLESNIPWTVTSFTDTVHSVEEPGYYRIGVQLE